MKRIISLVLAIVILVAFLPGVASAAAVPDKISVQPVLLMPKDMDIPGEAIMLDIAAVLSTVGDVRSFYVREIGYGFNVRKPVVIKAKQPLGALERFPGSMDYSQVWPWQYPAVLMELDDVFPRAQNVYYLVFLYGKTSVNWARWDPYSPSITVINDSVRSLLYGSENERRAGKGVIAHEFGHLGYLNDIIYRDGNEKTIMALSPDGVSIIFSPLFPEIGFTPRERATLNGAMSPDSGE